MKENTSETGNLVFITGGARSGKSSFALELANKVEGEKIYVATSEPLDSEMAERIRQHREERGSQWRTIEEPLEIAKVILQEGRGDAVILIDCLTLWVSNLISPADSTLFHVEQGAGPGNDEQPVVWEDAVGAADLLITALDTVKASSPRSSLFIVSNEVGMGIVPENPLARRFRDIAGMLNQRVASVADEVYTVISGMSLKLKG